MSNDKHFDEAIDRLKEIKKTNPTHTLSEILQNAADMKKKEQNTNLSNMNTKELLTALKEYASQEVKHMKDKKRVHR